MLVLLIPPTGILGESHGKAGHDPTANRSHGERAATPGDGLRRWWAGLTRFQKWGLRRAGLRCVGPAALPAAVQDAGISLRWHHGASSRWWPSSRSGSTSLWGQAGLLDLGYVGYAVGAHRRATHQSRRSRNRIGSWFTEKWALAVSHCRHSARRADLASRRCGFAVTTWPSSPGIRKAIIRLLADNLAGVTNGPAPSTRSPSPVGETEKLPDGVFPGGNSHGRQLRERGGSGCPSSSCC